MDPLTLLESRSLKLRCQKGHILSQVSKGESIHCFFQHWKLLAFLRPHHSLSWGHIIPISSPIFTSSPFPLCVSNLSLCLSLTRALVIGLRAHPDKPEPSLHLKILNLITFTKTFFPNKVTVIGSGNIF